MTLCLRFGENLLLRLSRQALTHNAIIKQHTKKTAKTAKVIITANTIMFIPSNSGGTRLPGVLSVSPEEKREN